MCASSAFKTTTSPYSPSASPAASVESQLISFATFHQQSAASSAMFAIILQSRAPDAICAAMMGY